MKFVKHEVTVEDVTEAELVYAVKDENDQTIGFVARKSFPTTSKSGITRSPKKWGFAFGEDEFRSGFQFLYQTRTHATDSLLADRALSAEIYG